MTEDTCLKTISIEFENALQTHGLTTFGWFPQQNNAGLLIGNAGGTMWQYFSASEEYGDGEADPMNRWTGRIIGEIVGQLKFREKIVKLCFPFGVPVYPFLTWAMLANGNRPSPAGISIDPEYGLWWALRAAVLFNDDKLLDEVKALNASKPDHKHPCDTCEGKPCLIACPVRAISFRPENEISYAKLDVGACNSHLDSGKAPHCMVDGCRARAICPIGREHEYCMDQIRFHMRSFRG